MLTRNWYKAISNSLDNTTKAVFKNLNGANYTADRAHCYFAANSNTVVTNVALGSVRDDFKTYGGVIFGTGTTPPSIDDYTISGDIITGLNSSAVFDTSFDDAGRTVTTTYTLTNTNDEAVTIGEIASVMGAGSSSSYAILLERTVLESPITIEPGGVGQVTYTIRMNYPTA